MSQFIEMFGEMPFDAKLKNLFSLIRNGANIKQGSVDDGIPITRIETISNGNVDRSKMGYAGIDNDKYESYYLQDGDILMSHINSLTHIGKCAIYSQQSDEIIIHGMNLLCMRPNDRIIPLFALFMLRSRIVKKQIEDITKPAVNQASFTVKDLNEINISTPSIEEQKQFVEIAKQADKSKFTGFKSQFIEMFGDKKRNNCRLGDYVNVQTGKLDANASDINGEYPFFTCGSETLKIQSFAFDCEAVILAGNGEFCVKYYNGKFNAYQRTYVIESKDTSILYTPFLFAWMKQYAETLKQRAIGGVIKYIKIGDIINARIIIPSIEEQNQYIAIVEQADKSKYIN